MTTRDAPKPGRARPENDLLVAQVAAAQAGDARATDALLAALRPRLFQVASWELLRRGLRLDAAELDDVVQEALIETWRTDLPRFDPARGGLLAFLRQRVRWTLLEHVRAKVRDRSHSLDEEMARGHDVEAPGHRPDERLAEAARERAIAALPGAVAQAAIAIDDAPARLALLRHDVEGVPLRRVARELGVHPSNATRARQRGLERLRASLGERYRDVARAVAP